MGFDCGISKTKRYNGITLKEIINLCNYLNWKNNPWNFEENHYPTYEKYWDSFCHITDDETFPGKPDADVIDFYEKEYKGKESIVEDIESWCSVGRVIKDYLETVLKKENTYYYYGFTSEVINEIIEHCNTEIERNNLSPYYIKKAFVKDEDGNVKEIKIDGIIIENDEGWEKKIYTDDEWGEPVYFPEHYYDEDKLYAWEKLKNAMISLLKEKNLEDYIIWFEWSV